MLHPELLGRFALNPSELPNNGIDDDGNGLIDDISGYDFLDDDPLVTPNRASGDPSHGTMMAIIALNAARTAVAGDSASADLIKVLPLRVADDRTVDAGAVADAIHYAGKRGENTVVNLSIGSSRSTIPSVLTSAIAAERRVVLVVAAGNQGTDIGEMRGSLCRVPTDNLVCVAAVDTKDKLSEFPKASNFGRLVDIAAVGVDVGVSDSKGSMHSDTGTSLAAAHVSGVAARLWSCAPELTAREIARVLCMGARKSKVLGDSVRCGIVHAVRSLRVAGSRSGVIGTTRFPHVDSGVL